MTSELKPCPFAAVVKEYAHRLTIGADEDSYNLPRVCCDCGARGPVMGFDAESAIEGWNTRTPDLTLLDVEDSKSLNNRLLHALHSQLESPEMEERFRGAALKAVSGRTYSEHNKDEWAAHVAQAIRAEIKEALGGSHE